MPIKNGVLEYTIPPKHHRDKVSNTEQAIRNLEWKIAFHKKCIADARIKIKELQELESDID